jgi:hypothetical protein
MAFVLVDLVVESVIRDGLANINKNPDLIDDVFASFLENYNIRKYGQEELDRLKDFIVNKQVRVVHSFGEVDAKVPSFSIQLGNDADAKREAVLSDFMGQEDTPFEDGSQEQIDTILVANGDVLSYEPNSGKLNFDLAVDLSDVTKNKKLVNADGEWVIIGPVINNMTERAVFIEKNQTIDISKPMNVVSQLDFTRKEINGIHSDVSILIGCHSKDALLTKYLYVLLKYFILSRKPDLIKRCFIASSFTGSDFTRNLEIKGDMVYTRFMTITGKTEDNWNGADVELFDDLQVQIAVPGDEATAEDLDRENSSVTVSTTLKC